jgi:hypothetical protein
MLTGGTQHYQFPIQNILEIKWPEREVYQPNLLNGRMEIK